MSTTSRWSAIVWLTYLLSVAGCSSGDAAQARLAELSHGCIVNSDCAAPLVCAFQRCHAECVTTRDCDGTLRCVGAHEQSRVCQLDEESQCKSSADCVPGLVCGQDGACRDQCAADSECIGDQVCTRGVCAEPSELDDAGELPRVTAQRTCRLASDCDEGEQCLGGACIAQCRESRDCPAEQVCEDGACRSAASTCEGEDCGCECHADLDCKAGSICDGCACQAGPAAECDSSLDCKDGKLCLAGSCECRCVEDRDCSSGATCDGCACRTDQLNLRVIHDATLRDGRDVLLMSNVSEVETQLLLTGGTLRSTTGLEQLRHVGTLTIQSAYGLASTEGAPPGLSGFAGLREIVGDLRIVSSNLNELPFDPTLKVGGNVVLTATSVPCAQIGAFEQALRAHGFQGSFEAYSTVDCGVACIAGQCQN